MNFCYIRAAFFFFSLCMLFSCTDNKNTHLPSTSDNTGNDTLVKIAVMPTLDCMPLYVAQENDMFEKEHVGIKLLRYTAQMDCDTAIQRGWADGVVTDLIRAERMQKEGIVLRYVAATNLSWQLFSNHSARIKTIKQLGDKMVGMTRYSATDFLITAMTDSTKPKNEVFRIQVNDVNIRLKMLLNNEIDAAFLPEPQATAARMANHRLLLDTREKDLQLGVLAFRSDKKTKRLLDKELPRLVKAYNMACDSLNTNGVEHYRDVLRKYYGLSDEVMNALPKKIVYKKVAAPREKDLMTARSF